MLLFKLTGLPHSRPMRMAAELFAHGSEYIHERRRLVLLVAYQHPGQSYPKCMERTLFVSRCLVVVVVVVVFYVHVQNTWIYLRASICTSNTQATNTDRPQQKPSDRPNRELAFQIDGRQLSIWSECTFFFFFYKADWCTDAFHLRFADFFSQDLKKMLRLARCKTALRLNCENRTRKKR